MRDMQKRQIRGLIEKQKGVIKSQKSHRKKMKAYGMWAGFLSGLRIGRSITHEEYKFLFDELKKFEMSQRKNEEYRRLSSSDLDEFDLWEGFFGGIRITKARYMHRIFVRNTNDFRRISN